jgi:hypothetical protein
MHEALVVEVVLRPPANEAMTKLGKPPVLVSKNILCATFNAADATMCSCYFVDQLFAKVPRYMHT